MYARSTTLCGTPEAVDAGVTLVQEQIAPAVEGMTGCLGMSVLSDRAAGRCIVTSAWHSQEEMHATEPFVARHRDRAQDLFGCRPDVREWEIALMHRGRAVPSGALARVTWTRVPPPAIDQQLEVFREGTLPLIEALPGYCSASLLVERHTGKAVLAVVYDSPEAMAASRVGADQLRVEVMRTTGARLLDVAEFDVVLARLRVPERV